jgi:hypothetical protein
MTSVLVTSTGIATLLLWHSPMSDDDITKSQQRIGQHGSSSDNCCMSEQIMEF